MSRHLGRLSRAPLAPLVCSQQQRATPMQAQALKAALAAFSPLVQIEAEHVYRLRAAHATVPDRIKSLHALAELEPCAASQEAVASCLQNEDLVVRLARAA